MGEAFPGSDPEIERESALRRLIEQYFPEDVEFILEQLLDEEDTVGFLYGQLLEIGEDPDEVLHEFGVTEATMKVTEVKPGYVEDGIELGGATDEI